MYLRIETKKVLQMWMISYLNVSIHLLFESILFLQIQRVFIEFTLEPGRGDSRCAHIKTSCLILMFC